MRKYTVTSLHEELDRLVAGRYPNLLVEGEVSQIQTPTSGHRYLTLRDRDNQLACVVWRDTWNGFRFQPKEGERVLCRGRLGVYGKRGNCQLYVTGIEAVGEGDLARKIAEIKARLLADGLLDARRKRPLPRFPRFVGVATSLRGAALQDFLSVSRRRFPAARILVADCVVQGETAPPSVIRAVELLLEDARSELVVVTRGGGSKEDLLAFNDEQLARFLAECPVPVVSAVGHQVDTTIADLVADAVAPTPTAAAVLVLPDGEALRQGVDDADSGLRAAVARAVRARRDRIAALRARLRHPGERLRELSRRRADLDERLGVAMLRRLEGERQRVDRASVRLAPAVSALVAAKKLRFSRSSERLAPCVEALVARRRARLEAMAGQLDALSPLAVLGRGYAIVQGRRGVVTDPAQVRHGERVLVRVEKGSFTAVVRHEAPVVEQLGLFGGE